MEPIPQLVLLPSIIVEILLLAGVKLLTTPALLVMALRLVQPQERLLIYLEIILQISL
jgi:hypothetical protein